MDVNEEVPISYQGGSSIWPPLIGDLRSKINFFVSPAPPPVSIRPIPIPARRKTFAKLRGKEGEMELFFFFLHLHPLSCLHCMSPSSRSSSAGTGSA